MGSPAIPVAIIGTGNIGTDLMIKITDHSPSLVVATMVGIDPRSDGLAKAVARGIPVTADGVEGLVSMPGFGEIQFVFDATSASAHVQNAAKLAPYGKQLIDLTPAALGPFVVPTVNLDRHLDAPNINMVTCGGQATVPIVAAVNSVSQVHYSEIVASIASKSAGPGTRANIDEFTETTGESLERVGGATHGKAIVILNPAEPPLIMRDTVLCIVDNRADRVAITRAVDTMVSAVAEFVPGYQLKQEVQFTDFDHGEPLSPLVDGLEAQNIMRVSVFLEVEGAAHYLPAYAGNLDIMTSAAVRVAEKLAQRVAVGGPA